MRKSVSFILLHILRKLKWFTFANLLILHGWVWAGSDGYICTVSCCTQQLLVFLTALFLQTIVSLRWSVPDPDFQTSTASSGLWTSSPSFNSCWGLTFSWRVPEIISVCTGVHWQVCLPAVFSLNWSPESALDGSVNMSSSWKRTFSFLHVVKQNLSSRI